MNSLNWGKTSFAWLLRADVFVGAALLILLIVTLFRRDLVLPRRAYLAGALVGFLAWLGFLAASGEILVTTQRTTLFAVAVIMTWLPYILLAEVAILCWLGAHRPWRELFLTVVILAAVAMRFPEILSKLLRR